MVPDEVTFVVGLILQLPQQVILRCVLFASNTQRANSTGLIKRPGYSATSELLLPLTLLDSSKTGNGRPRNVQLFELFQRLGGQKLRRFVELGSL